MHGGRRFARLECPFLIYKNPSASDRRQALVILAMLVLVRHASLHVSAGRACGNMAMSSPNSRQSVRAPPST